MSTELANREPRQGEKVYQCQGCLTISLGHPPVPPQSWFEEQERLHRFPPDA